MENAAGHPSGRSHRWRIGRRAKRNHNFGIWTCLRGYYDHSDTMPIIQVIVLAVIQGITEFLPVQQYGRT